ncbi:MAG: peptidylprolyl isomerase [Armatimonadota bacterium]
MIRYALLVVGLTLAGCALAVAGAPRKPARKPAPPPLRAPTEREIAAAKKAGKVMVELDTDRGKMTLELDGKAAPAAVANFLNLVKAGFYNGMPFHRVEPGFVIQAGDPALVGRPPVGYTIPDEKSPIKHKRGVIAMARLYKGGQMLPNSASTQFYVCLGDAPHLDAMGFTAFGKVTKGIEVIDQVRVGDKIRKARLLARGPVRAQPRRAAADRRGDGGARR